MNDGDSLPTTIPTTNLKEENSDSSMLGKGWYKFWALAIILLLVVWSIFIGTVILRWSAENLNRLLDDKDIQIHDDLDVLEMEKKEKMVKHMWEGVSGADEKGRLVSGDFYLGTED